jgi:toxin ParE1/3/4
MSLGDRAKGIVWAPRAKRDLHDIWRYFARIASVEVADNLVHEVNRAAARLADFPLMGRTRDELIPGLRSVLVHPHVIFYRVSEASIEIARVLHQRRDLATALRTRGDTAR